MYGNLFGVIAASLVIERVVEQFSEFVPKKKRRKILFLISTILALLFTFGAQVGIFRNLGIISQNTGKFGIYLDYLLTGLLIGGGSDPVHSVVYGLEKKKEEIVKRTSKKDNDN